MKKLTLLALFTVGIITAASAHLQEVSISELVFSFLDAQNAYMRKNGHNLSKTDSYLGCSQLFNSIQHESQSMLDKQKDCLDNKPTWFSGVDKLPLATSHHLDKKGLNKRLIQPVSTEISIYSFRGTQEIDAKCSNELTLLGSASIRASSNDLFTESQLIPYIPPLFSISDSLMLGCTDATALNFNPLADIDDGSCIYPPANDLCSNAIAISCDQTLSGTTVNSTFDNVGICTVSNTSPGVWYSFVGTGTPATVSTCGQATFDTKLSVFTGNCGSLVCVGGNDDFSGCSGFTSRITFPTTMGTTYRVLVHAFSSNSGNFSLTLTCAPQVLGCTDPNSINFNASANTDDGSCIPFPSTCALALSVGLGNHNSGAINSGNGANNGCVFPISGNATHARWFTFTPSVTAEYVIQSAGLTSVDTRLSIYTGACGSLVCYANNDDVGGASFASRVITCMDAGTTYFIEWDNRWSSASFNWSISSNGPATCVCNLALSSAFAIRPNCPGESSGLISLLATSSADSIRYAITGPVNASNSIGTFNGLPSGDYNWLITDSNLCELSSSISVGVGSDTVPPNLVCKSTTVLLSPDGTYTLSGSDVLDEMASSDNCGSLSLVNIAPMSFDCDDLGGTFAVTVTAQDGNNNSATCTAMITVDVGDDLPAPWQSFDIGGANSQVSYDPCAPGDPSIDLSSTGFTGFNSDKQNFVAQTLCGNTSITVKIEGISGGGWAGVQIRENVAPGSKKAVLKTQLSNIIRREARATTNGMTQSQQLIRPGQTWLRLTRSGSQIAGFSSNDGINWLFAFATNIQMNTCVQVGIITESINQTTTTAATFSNLSIEGGQTLAMTDVDSERNTQLDLINPSIWPNPSSGAFFISIPQEWTQQPYEIIVRDLMGNVVYNRSVSSVEIRNSIQLDQPPGTYFLSLVPKDQLPLSYKLILTSN
jgi:regulation of enolase protein 1 (concanavalin A-like superfamily)